MAEKLGAVFVEIDGKTEKFERDLNRIKRQTDKDSKKMSAGFSKNWMGSLVKVAAGLGAFRVALGALKGAKNAARDAQEIENKYLTVFENVQKEAVKTAETFAENFGLAGSSAEEMLGATGDLLVGFGFTEKAALDMSKQVNELAVDLASFTNYSGGAKGASLALTKAILGETESVKALGIVLRQGTTDFKDKLDQLMKNKGLTENQARAEILLAEAYRQSGKAVGDYGRTQDSVANLERQLAEATKQMSESFGKFLIPALKASIPLLISATKHVKGLFDALADKSTMQLAKSSAGIKVWARTLFNMATTGSTYIEAYGEAVSKYAKELDEAEKSIKKNIKAEEELNKTQGKKPKKQAVSLSDEDLAKQKAAKEKALADEKQAVEQYYRDVKWLSADYYNYRLETINKEAEAMQKAAGGQVDVEKWKNQQILELNKERQDLLDEMIDTVPFQMSDEEPDLNTDIAVQQAQKLENSLLSVWDSVKRGENVFKAFGSVVASEVERIIAKLAAVQILNLLGGAIGGPIGGLLTGHNGGTFQDGKKIASFAGGGDFIVPRGYNRDTFPMMVESGERVQVTPTNKIGQETKILNSMNARIEALNNNMIMMQGQKPNVSQSLFIEGNQLRATVETSQNRRKYLGAT